MKSRKPKRYARDFAVIIQDSQGAFPEKCRAISPQGAAEECEAIASGIGGRIIAVIENPWTSQARPVFNV